MQSAQLVVAKREFPAEDSQIISRSSKENQQSIVLPQQQAEDEQGALLAQWITNISDKVEYLEERDIQSTIKYRKAEKIIASLYKDLKKVNKTLDKTQRTLQVLEREYDEAVLKVGLQGRDILQLQQQQVEREESLRQLSIKVMQFEGKSVCQIIEKQLPVLRALFNDSHSLGTEDRNKLHRFIQDLEKKNVDITKLLNRSELSLEQHSNLKLWIQETHILLDAINAAIATWEVSLTKNLHTETQVILNQIQAQDGILKGLKRLVLEESPKQNHELILSIDDLKDVDDHLKDLQNWKDKLEGIINDQRIPLSKLEKTRRALGNSIDYLPRISRAVKRLSTQVSTDIKSVALEFMALSEQKIAALKASKTLLEQRAERINNPLTFPQNKKNEVTAFLQQFAEKVQEITALKDLSVMNIEQMFALRGMLFGVKARFVLIEEKKQVLHELILIDFNAEANQLIQQVADAFGKTHYYLGVLEDVAMSSTVFSNVERTSFNTIVRSLEGIIDSDHHQNISLDSLVQLKLVIQKFKQSLSIIIQIQLALTNLATSIFQKFSNKFRQEFKLKIEACKWRLEEIRRQRTLNQNPSNLIKERLEIIELVRKYEEMRHKLDPLIGQILGQNLDVTTLEGLKAARAMISLVKNNL